MPDPVAELRDALDTLRASYRQRLHAQVAEVGELANALRREVGRGATPVLERLALLAHSLTGSGSTFGFASVSEHAQPLEILVRDLLERQASPSPAEVARVHSCACLLEAAAAR